MQTKKPLRIIRKVERDYNSIASEWDRSRSHPSAMKKKLLKSIKVGMEVLDVGCGNGLMIPEVIKRGGKYTGIDISAKLLAIAKRRYQKELSAKKIRLVKANAIKLPFKDNSFDFIFSLAVLHHIPSVKLREGFFSEVYRVLKSDRRAVIKVWNLLSSWASQRYGIKRLLEEDNSAERDLLIPWKATPSQEIKRYFHLFSSQELINLAKDAGFKNIRVNFYNRTGQLEKNGEDLVIILGK